jgi:flagellar hook assembly protein FlgD
MHHASSYAVTQRSAIQIFYGKRPGDISSEVAVAGKVFPNPFNRSSTDALVFPFALPPSGHDYSVQIEILDARGMRVKNVLNEKLSPGFYEVKWEGHDEEGKICASGMYVYRVTLSQHGMAKTITEKLIITN